MAKLVKLCSMLFPVLVIGFSPLTVAADSVNVHSFELETIEGEKINLADYKGKALLIVNTASRCGYTRQYKSMEALYQKFKGRGFEVLAFPANNFKQQEPGTNEEIKKFCYMTYKTTFPLFAKSSVKGADINPLYEYLTTKSSFAGPISWNFNKFLVNADGDVVARYGSPIDPLSDPLVKKLETILPKLK